MGVVGCPGPMACGTDGDIRGYTLAGRARGGWRLPGPRGRHGRGYTFIAVITLRSAVVGA